MFNWISHVINSRFIVVALSIKQVATTIVRPLFNIIYSYADTKFRENVLNWTSDTGSTQIFNAWTCSAINAHLVSIFLCQKVLDLFMRPKIMRRTCYGQMNTLNLWKFWKQWHLMTFIEISNRNLIFMRLSFELAIWRLGHSKKNHLIDIKCHFSNEIVENCQNHHQI